MTSSALRHAATALRPLAIAAGIAAAFTPASHAQTSTQSLEPVIVTAARTAQKAGDVIADHVVITSEDIAQSGQTSLIDLLQTQRSVEITRNGGAGNSATVAIRGGTSKQTLLLIDGVRSFSSTSGEPTWSAIPLSQIDHIEIVLGPMAVLYGADAVGGVIQIFTKKGDGKPHPTFSAGAGSYGEEVLTAGVYGSTQGDHVLRYAFNASREESRGFSSTNKLVGKSFDPDDDGYSKRSASGSLSMELAKGQEIGASFLSSRNDGEYDTSLAKNYNPHLISEVDVYSVYTRNRITDNWTSLFQVSRNEDKSRTYTSPKASVIESQQDRYTWQNDIALGTDLLQIVAEHLHEEAALSADENQDRDTDSLAVAYQMKRGNHIGSAGIRYDDNSIYGSQVTGSLGYGYHLTQAWRVNGSVGTSFRAPTFNDLYYPGYGNLDAKPEKGKNAEIGIYYDDGRTDFSAVYYRNHLTDMLVTVKPCPITGAGNCYYNVEDAVLSGLSLAAGTRFGNFALHGTLDLQDPRNETNDTLLARRARSHGSISLDYASGAWTVGSDVFFSGYRYDDDKNTEKKRLGGYTLLNLHATYDLTDNWQLFGRWNNVTNKDYTLAYGYETPGSNVFVGVRYGFQ
ncbi:TonB-dependent receptor domain-containing protein [Oxalicibacterium solurbis]|uniref:Outer membrane protein n=1 Tax=Oxalicibacterium solurbis TaxID=69280 RepID=A0A8J3AW14_9BURK|nr:TonB-dependent receptor [Oxalicibacterium solurbis]GGI54340.1 outer membrane protein [Oxalicibacterium solurbis]